jgi:carboxypeptidase Taq
MTSNNNNYNAYVQLMQKAADLNNAAAVLGWDQEVYMPPKSAPTRARQLATLAAMAHSILTSAEMEDLLQQLLTDYTLTDIERANVLRSSEDFDRNSKLPEDFVEKLSLQTSECFNAWIEARQKNDFNIFQPSLAKMVALKQQQCELYGYSNHPYDALVADYEPGATVEMLDKVFEGIRNNLPPLLNAIKNATQVNDDFFYKYYPKDQQWNFSIDVLRAMSYDFEAGRQDLSEHPFTTSFSATDVRVTTRVDEHNYASLLWSTIHEGGHALYEQGLPESAYGLPLGAAASLGIHESQSRLWENCVGRSLAFWQHFQPKLKTYFPDALANVSAEDIMKACNKVIPSLIRTEADELTYHFHVMIRYELEKQLLTGSLAVSDLKDAWNEAYQKYLGITPTDDKHGVLQDVHWSHGSFGYFPTYTLGSFYAAQFYQMATTEMPNLEEEIKHGKMENLVAWLRSKVHAHGRRYYSEELCTRITGEGLNPKYFTDYARKKYAMVYGINL